MPSILDSLFSLTSQLVMCHSPSGVEHEIDDFLRAHLTDLAIELTSDACGNLVARIRGKGAGLLCITAHKDEIGATVTHAEEDGRLQVRNLGGSFPWVYGEGVVDILGDSEVVSGILSFGSRHVSHASPQFAHRDEAPLKWEHAWIETKLTTERLNEAGIRPGSRVVVGKHRKAAFRIGDHIASYALDNKASLAMLLELGRRVKDPPHDIVLVATAKEEVGAIGSLFFTRENKIDALVALEICPLAPEYSVKPGVAPVLLAEDGSGIYDEGLNRLLRNAASARNIDVQLAVLNSFGSDGSYAMKEGHVARAACLSFPTQNTHGYEIAHLGAIANCVDILEELCSRGVGDLHAH